MKKLFVFGILCFVILFSTNVFGQEAYAVFDEESGTLTFKYDDKKPEGAYGMRTHGRYWSNDNWSTIYSKIKKVIFHSSFADYQPTSCAYWFYHCSNLSEIVGMKEYLNTENVTDMSYMFEYCSKLTSLDLSGFNTENVTNMSYMFYECRSLTSLDLSGFNTENVTSMYDMFSCCRSLTSLDLSCFNTEKVTGMSYMFHDCRSLTSLDLSGFNTENVTSMSYMFSDCICLKTIYVNVNWNTTSVVYSDDMFYFCNSLYGGYGTHYDGISDIKYTCIDEGEKNPGYFTKKGSKNFVPMEYTVFKNGTLTFYYGDNKPADEKVYYIGGYGSDRENIHKVVFDESFKNCKPKSCMYWFYDCTNLSIIDGIKNLNTEEVTNMYEMFRGCYSLTSLDLSSLNTKNVERMDSMFYRCSNLTSLNLNNFNTEKVNTMSGMFYDCNNLTSLDLSSFNTEKVTSMSWMFSHCNSLTNLDLSSFNTKNVTDMDYMFWDCNNLKTIYVSDYWTTKNVASSYIMFDDCKNLIGERGTKCNGDWNNNNLQFAKIDGGEENPGYFTRPEISSISIFKNPESIVYQGSTWETIGGEITVIYNSGTKKIISFNTDGVEITDFNSKTQTFTIEYSGKKAAFSLEEEPTEEKKVTEIAITTVPEKLEYLEGEIFKADGGVLTVYYNNGENKTIDLDDNSVKISGFDNTTPGKQTLKIEYLDKETELIVTVKAKSAVSISLTTSPAKMEYSKGETLDLSDGEITVKYDNGDEEIIGLSAAKVSDYDRNNPGKQTLTIQYLGFSTTFEVEVKQPEIIEKPEQPDVETSTGDLAVNRPVKIWSFEKTVFVENAETSIYVVDLSGHVIKTVKPKHTRTEIRIDQTGVYIIKTGLKTKKVVIQ